MSRYSAFEGQTRNEGRVLLFICNHRGPYLSPDGYDLVRMMQVGASKCPTRCRSGAFMSDSLLRLLSPDPLSFIYLFPYHPVLLPSFLVHVATQLKTCSRQIIARILKEKSHISFEGTHCTIKRPSTSRKFLHRKESRRIWHFWPATLDHPVPNWFFIMRAVTCPAT